MAGFSFLESLFGRGSKSPRQTAKDRLQLVLMHDRADISAPMLEDLKRDILQVFSKYMEIDDSQLDVNIERVDNAVALIANIPIRRVRDS